VSQACRSETSSIGPADDLEIPSCRRFLADESDTLTAGAWLAGAVLPGLKIWLYGDLGAGKTTLVRGLLRALGFSGRVKSPTFALVEIYEVSSFNVYHFDLYRLLDPEEWEEAGFREFFNGQSLCLVEWPEKGEGVLPEADLALQLDILEEGRQLTVTGRTEAGKQCVEKLSHT